MSEAVTQLTESLLQQFKNETFVLLNTVDIESGARHPPQFPGSMRRMRPRFGSLWIIVHVL